MTESVPSRSARRRGHQHRPLSRPGRKAASAVPSFGTSGALGETKNGPGLLQRAAAGLGRFWPGGCIAVGCVAAALWLDVNGLTRPAELPAVEAVAPLDEDLLAEMEAAEREGVELVDEWERHRQEASRKSSSVTEEAEEHVATYMARSYRLAPENARQLVAWAVEIGEGFNVDPLLILSVAAIESSFNPKARSAAGAEGLMQVMTRVHRDRFKAFGGAPAALEPYPSLVVGTSILAGYVRRTGSVARALKWYCGAANRDSDGGYAERVLMERSRMQVAAAGDSGAAVRLSRTKKTGPAYAASAPGRAKVKQLGFEEWRRFGTPVETHLTGGAPSVPGTGGAGQADSPDQAPRG